MAKAATATNSNDTTSRIAFGMFVRLRVLLILLDCKDLAEPHGGMDAPPGGTTLHAFGRYNVPAVNHGRIRVAIDPSIVDRFSLNA